MKVACILNARSEPVAIGAIEKFINEYAFRHHAVEASRVSPNGLSVAVAGSGPGGMACADELAKLGYAVTIFRFPKPRPAVCWLTASRPSSSKSTVVERRLNLLRRTRRHAPYGVNNRTRCLARGVASRV